MSEEEEGVCVDTMRNPVASPDDAMAILPTFHLPLSPDDVVCVDDPVFPLYVAVTLI